MIRKPRITVAAVVEQEGSFLLVEERVDGRLVLNQPAGHLEPDESLLAAVVRECREETAHRFLPTALVGIYRWQSPGHGDAFLRFCFAGTAESRIPDQPLDKDIERTLWLSHEELMEQQHGLRSPLVLCGVEDYIAGRRYPLDILVDLPSPGGKAEQGEQR